MMRFWRFPSMALAALGVLALGGLAFSSAPAAASTLYQYSSSFGPDGTAASSFLRPGAVAVDQSDHDVYVADLGSGALYKFNQAGEPADFSALGSNEISGFEFNGEGGVSQIAVNSTTHDIYVVDNEADSIEAFQASGEPAEFSALGSNELEGFEGIGESGGEEFEDFEEVCGVAVDSNGDIYVGDYNGGLGGGGVVAVFAPSGESLTSFPTREPCNVAVDSHGAVYVNRYQSSVAKFTPSPFPVSALTSYHSAGAVESNAAYGLTVDPATDDLYVDERTKIAVFDEQGQLTGEFGATGAGALSESEGLAVDGSTGAAYVSDAGGARQVEVFAAGSVPTVTTEPAATDPSQGTAILNGAVNPNGVELTECEFEWGEAPAYSHSAPCEQTPTQIGTGESPVAVTASLSGLLPNATYHYRLTAKNNAGPGDGEDRTLMLPVSPAIAQPPTASNETRTGVLLHATLDPERSDTHYHFLYGTSESYGQSTTSTDAGSTQAEQTITPVPVNELQPGTLYHYRLIATNAAGSTESPDETFTTSAPTPPIVATGAYSALAQNTVTISGTLDTQGLPATYGFEIATSTNYGPPTGLGAIGAGADETTVSLSLSGLQPGTTYHYRLTASDVDGTIYGADQTFTTTTFGISFATPPAPLPFVSVPQIPFPPEATATKATTKPKALTKAQKLTRALKACRKDTRKSQRVKCETTARRRYVPGKKRKKK